MTVAGVAALTGSAVAQTSSDDVLPAPGAPKPQIVTYAGQPGANDVEWVRTAIAAAHAGNLDQVRIAMTSATHPVAKKLIEYVAAENLGPRLSFAEIDQARRDLQAWPHKSNRQAFAERALEGSGLSARQIADWFKAEPATAEGAMALAGAYQQLGRANDVQTLVRHFWRERTFEADSQRLMLVRFGTLLTVDDHIRRADTLLYGPQGPALHDMLEMLPADWRQVAEARIALRTGSRDAEALYEAVPAEHRRDPGLAVARARWLYDRDRGQEALPLIADFPKAPPEDASSSFWLLRRQLVNVAVKVGDFAAAHKAVDDHGLRAGSDAADAEFLGGWLALTKLHDPADAERHFARLEVIGASPITASRALYWRGRATEALGDPVGAQSYYGRGAKYYTTFYGQLAAAKAGMTELDLGKDPVPTAKDRARFDSLELIQAARLLNDAGARDLYRSMLIASLDTLTQLPDVAQLIDMADATGSSDLQMRLARLAAQKGLTLPERGFPVRSSPDGSPVEQAMVLGIIRQESGFDAHIRSSVGARGMMQLMPATAKGLAKRAGMKYRDAMLDDADYNMRLGSNFLGQLVENFDGSYIMAAAAYNAGPGRPPQWVTICGDPRGTSIDPVDYIECIPIGETRNYVMRVLENVEVYRARLNNGRAPLTIVQDLKRGGYGVGPRPYTEVALNTASAGLPTATATDVVSSTPVPDPPARLIRSPDHAKAKPHKTAAKTIAHKKSKKKKSSAD